MHLIGFLLLSLALCPIIGWSLGSLQWQTQDRCDLHTLSDLCLSDPVWPLFSVLLRHHRERQYRLFLCCLSPRCLFLEIWRQCSWWPKADRICCASQCVNAKRWPELCFSLYGSWTQKFPTNYTTLCAALRYKLASINITKPKYTFI